MADDGAEQTPVEHGDATAGAVDESDVSDEKGTDAATTDEFAEIESAQRGHSRLPTVLVGVATVLAILTVFTVWGRTQALDTDEWVTLSTELLDEPEVQQALSEQLVEALYDDGDVVAGLEELLPEDLEGLAGAVAGALRGPLTDGVEQLLDSDRFQALWETANRTAHETLVSILRDETREGISTSDGVVALELNSLVVAIGESLGLSEDRLSQIPDDAGRIVIFESDELDAVQTLVEILEFMAWFLFVLIVAMYAFAVWVAKGRRLRVLRNIGWSLAGVGVVVLAARAIAVRALVDAIVEDPGSRSSIDVVASVATALLRQLGWSLMIYGLLIVLFTSLLGDRGWAVATRRVLAPALNASTGAIVGGTVMLLLVLWWWSPARVFAGWTTGLTLIALISGAVAALRSSTQREFPDTTFDDIKASLSRSR